MIQSFSDKNTESIFRGKPSGALPKELHKVARRKLDYLDVAKALGDLRIPPANRLEKLKGNRQGQFSIRINDQWRICFTWKGQDAHEVAIVDYH